MSISQVYSVTITLTSALKYPQILYKTLPNKSQPIGDRPFCLGIYVPLTLIQTLWDNRLITGRGKPEELDCSFSRIDWLLVEPLTEAGKKELSSFVAWTLSLTFKLSFYYLDIAGKFRLRFFHHGHLEEFAIFKKYHYVSAYTYSLSNS